MRLIVHNECRVTDASHPTRSPVPVLLPPGNYELVEAPNPRFKLPGEKSWLVLRSRPGVGLAIPFWRKRIEDGLASIPDPPPSLVKKPRREIPAKS